jgi:hypothetical protein
MIAGLRTINETVRWPQVRPVEYCVILDEIGFTMEDITLLTNSLCYTYQRCTRCASRSRPKSGENAVVAFGQFKV